jgi:hypothetical protein
MCINCDAKYSHKAQAAMSVPRFESNSPHAL